MKLRPITLHLGFVVATCGALVGCSQKKTIFDVADYRDSGKVERYFQPFDECYYCYDGASNLEIVARHSGAGQDGSETTQVIHLHTFWVPRPGKTRAERTMINATVNYMLVRWPTGASFDGSGFFSFTENRSHDTIQGTLELSSLQPQRRLGAAERIFERAELKGQIVAKRSRSKVLSILHDMDRLFGPLTRSTPAEGKR